MKRLCRYLSGAPRLVYVYRLQEVAALDVYTDTDWAGCARTRKSTSGGCALLGGHTSKHWSSTQASVTLSSGEAEFHGVVKGAGTGLGLQALLRDFGFEIPMRLWVDSSAAIGICSRQGLGKLRHLDTKMLWVQQAVRSGKVDLRKIPGVVNPADLFTKHSLSRERVLALTRLLGCEFKDGRASAAPTLRHAKGAKQTMKEAEENGHFMVQDEDLAQPLMPHRCLSSIDLDALYPSVLVPAQPDNPDPTESDPITEHGGSHWRRRDALLESVGCSVALEPGDALLSERDRRRPREVELDPEPALLGARLALALQLALAQRDAPPLVQRDHHEARLRDEVVGRAHSQQRLRSTHQ